MTVFSLVIIFFLTFVMSTLGLNPDSDSASTRIRIRIQQNRTENSPQIRTAFFGIQEEKTTMENITG